MILIVVSPPGGLQQQQLFELMNRHECVLAREQIDTSTLVLLGRSTHVMVYVQHDLEQARARLFPLADKMLWFDEHKHLCKRNYLQPYAFSDQLDEHEERFESVLWPAYVRAR